MRQAGQSRVPAWRNKASKPLKKPVRGEVKLPASQESYWRDPQGPRMYTNPPTQEAVPERPNLIVVVEGVTENWQRAEQAPLFPLRPLPQIQCHNAATSITPPQ